MSSRCSRRSGRSAAWRTRSTSFSMRFAETGAWGVYVGTTPATAHTVMEILTEEIERMMSEGVTEAELERAKGHMRGGLALSMGGTPTPA